mmetsp:Transcript_12489/g.17020  ORF Transcript_12489/g.17020 Transcript_12489/m.17020 type:complete len:549 (-) Transcript_12489:1034-2680(-)|eukprot:CAMPEP_0196575208 /NCGR_PEP_ID=MMETSP1081-20130531/4729_1 /TAXON_ID=36882 /ORGANISM="Pyramimonas amylifera, Strain CCMP720" /LENGTH=548 /DNA_ID=CAMNT_0041893429 /DNA_START=387 /DNA_END=2033 /DNA_ORIENTATION=+
MSQFNVDPKSTRSNVNSNGFQGAPSVGDTDESLSVNGTDFTLPQGSTGTSGVNFGISGEPASIVSGSNLPPASAVFSDVSAGVTSIVQPIPMGVGGFEFDESDDDEGYPMPSLEEALHEGEPISSPTSQFSVASEAQTTSVEFAQVKRRPSKSDVSERMSEGSYYPDSSHFGDKNSYLLPDITAATGAVLADLTQNQFQEVWLPPAREREGSSNTSGDANDLSHEFSNLDSAGMSDIRPEIMQEVQGSGQALAVRVLNRVKQQEGETSAAGRSKAGMAKRRFKMAVNAISAAQRIVVSLDQLRILPVPADVGVVKGYVVVDNSASGNPTYRFFLQEENVVRDRFVMAAKKDYSDPLKSQFVFSVDPTEVNDKSNGYFGRVVSNFVGSKYTIFDRGQKKKATQPEELERRVLGAIVYEPTSMRQAGGYRRMTVLLPNAYKGKDKSGNNVLARWDDMKDLRNLHLLITRIPSYKKINGSWHYCYKWGGRVKEPSVKNFQLVLHGEQEVTVLLCGKMSKNIYALDFTHPLSAHQAFAIAMTSIDSKLCMAM